MNIFTAVNSGERYGPWASCIIWVLPMCVLWWHFHRKRTERNEIEIKDLRKQEMETPCGREVRIWKTSSGFSKSLIGGMTEHQKNVQGHAKLMRLMGFERAIWAHTMTFHATWCILMHKWCKGAPQIYPCYCMCIQV